MVAAGEDELICDFAQFYHVINWRGSLPLLLAATLAAGLPEDSRCQRRLMGQKHSTDTILLAKIADIVALLLWRYAEKGTPKPRSLEKLLEGEETPEPKHRVFASGAVFDRELSKFIKKEVV